MTQPDFSGKVSKVGGAVGLSEKELNFYYYFFYELEKFDHEFYLIFSVKLGDHKHRKVTQPDFLGKLSKSGRGSYNGQNSHS